MSTVSTKLIFICREKGKRKQLNINFRNKDPCERMPSQLKWAAVKASFCQKIKTFSFSQSLRRAHSWVRAKTSPEESTTCIRERAHTVRVRTDISAFPNVRAGCKCRDPPNHRSHSIHEDVGSQGCDSLSKTLSFYSSLIGWQIYLSKVNFWQNGIIAWNPSNGHHPADDFLPLTQPHPNWFLHLPPPASQFLLHWPHQSCGSWQ